MTSRRSNRALSTTRRWTAGVLLATTLTAGGLGLHLADAYASNQSATVGGRHDERDRDVHLDVLDVVLGHLVLVRVQQHRFGEQLVQQRQHHDDGILMTIHQHTFRAIGCTNSVLTTDATTLEAAASVTEAMVDELDRVASRFRPDSEISRLTAAAAVADVDVVVSELLGGCIQAAPPCRRHHRRSGRPDGRAGGRRRGYDVDLDAVRARGDWPDARTASSRCRSPGGAAVGYDAATRTLLCPRGTMLDLGATAKAYAADLIAAPPGARAARRAPREPRRRHRRVGSACRSAGGTSASRTRTVVVRQVVVSCGQAVAHLVDPAADLDGRRRAAPSHRRPAHGPDRAIRLVPGHLCRRSALEANAATTAAVVLGERGPEWLAGHGLPARLDPASGTRSQPPGWPNPERRAA